MSSSSATDASARSRRHTGMVELIVEGERPPAKTGGEILDLAGRTEFTQDSTLVVEHEGGKIEYVPAAHSTNALGETLVNGRLVFKFTVTGHAPPDLATLPAGTYYSFVDFVEGPDADQGRWIGRIVDDAGKVVRAVPGVEVKQVFAFHVSDAERADHEKPSMHMHGLAAEDAAQSLDDEFKKARGSGWMVTSGDWKPHGAGCEKTFFCMPALQ